MSDRPEKHGVFYPRGYVIVSFKSAADAEKVRGMLVDGGYDEGDVHVLDTKRVLEGTTEDLRQLSPLIKALGNEGEVVQRHQSGAAAGYTFLLAYAPSDLDTERVINVARKVGYDGAHKYDRFTITKL
ncbi:MAG TPA: hypothetical protein VG500_01825 [Gemmatimonadales bacterium]|nr:hypothetical protein [Gemmatimonadales bacterium]